MNIMKVFILLMISNLSFAGVDETKLHLKVLDLYNKDKVLLLKPLKLYDNEKLEGKLQIEIQNDRVIDYRNGAGAEFLFKDFIGYKKKGYENIPYLLKKIPIAFLKIDCCRLLVEIESYQNLVFKTFGDNYYFKINPENVGNSLNSMFIWPINKSPSYVNNIIKNDKQISEILSKIQICSKKQSIQCMLDLDKNFEVGAKEWTVFSNEEFCNKYRFNNNYDELEKQINIISADWDLIDNFLKLDSPKQEFKYRNIGLENNEEIYIELRGNDLCSGISRFSIRFNRAKEQKWIFELNHSPGE